MINFINTLLEYLQNKDNLPNIITGVVIAAVLIIFKSFIAKVILSICSKILYKKDEENAKKCVSALKRPFSYFFVIIGIELCISINGDFSIIYKIGNIFYILVAAWFFITFFDNELFLAGRITANINDKISETAIKFLSNIFKVLTIIFAFVMVISELGYNINGLITGLGVGGLAVSLAAQEAIGNMISGFVIIFDKPFVVGDEIMCDNIRGFVEEVNMRSTRIRTLSDSLLTVPNSTLTKSAVTNISRIEKHRIELSFGLVYSTTNDVLEKIREDIEQFIIDDEDILPQPLRLHFTKFEDSSLNYDLVCYTTTSNLDEYLEVKNKINLKIKEIVEANGAEFAFPTTTVVMNK